MKAENRKKYRQRITAYDRLLRNGAEVIVMDRTVARKALAALRDRLKEEEQWEERYRKEQERLIRYENAMGYPRILPIPQYTKRK